jgi:hypothetical protein
MVRKGGDKMAQNDEKMLVSTRIRTRGLPEREKSENFSSKALALCHGG